MVVIILWWVMSKDDDYKNGVGDELKKDFGNLFKHSKRAMKDLFRGINRKNMCGGINFGFPFLSNKNPFLALFYPKLIVAVIILLTLLLCGVSIYGLIIIILLAIIFILI